MKLNHFFPFFLLFFVIQCASTMKTASSWTSDCENAPDGMVCIPAGTAVIGSTQEEANLAISQTKDFIRDRSAKLKKAKSRSEIADLKEEIAFMKTQIGMIQSEVPRYTVELDTFYIDKHEVTNQDYNECVEKGGCTPYSKLNSPMFKDALGASQPAVPIDWRRAQEFCTWKGKRLPTEAEWEKVARGGDLGTQYPWGNEEPSCDRANYKYCTNDVTKPVGSYPPGHYGVYDLAGNGYEWVNDWASECRTGECKNSCGSDCVGKNPQGPCGGKTPCGKLSKKVLKGGSWWWSPVHARGASRRLENMNTGSHRLSVRCASDSPILTNSPAWMIRNPKPNDSTLSEISSSQKKTLHNLSAVDVLDKPICKQKYYSTATCKDPMTYIKTNEGKNWYFADYIKNLRGGYAGVAADLNYTLIAHAKSEWVWLYDFDSNIIAYHRFLKPLILKAENPDVFISYFTAKNQKSAISVIEEYYKDHEDLESLVYTYKRFRSTVYSHYVNTSKPLKQFDDFGWLRSQSAYSYIRKLHQLDRISINPGDMLKDKTIRSIGKSARELGVTIKVYYPSNAEEFWKFSDTYKKNILSLPFDNETVMLSTIDYHYNKGFSWHNMKKSGTKGLWHYVVRGGKNFQKKLENPHYNSVNDFHNHRIMPYNRKDFSTILLPGNLE